VTKRNLTVQLEDDVIKRAKVLAARRGTSVSTLVATELERLVADDDRYQDAYRRAERALAGAANRRGRRWRRDDLHDRCPCRPSSTPMSWHMPTTPPIALGKSRQLLYDDSRVGGRQSGHVVSVAGQDDAAPGLDSGGNDMRMDQQSGAGAHPGKDAPDDTGERPVGVTRADAGLALQAGVDQLVAARPTVEFGQHHRRHGRFPSQAVRAALSAARTSSWRAERGPPSADSASGSKTRRTVNRGT
jgi:hypothetical protein